MRIKSFLNPEIVDAFFVSFGSIDAEMLTLMKDAINAHGLGTEVSEVPAEGILLTSIPGKAFSAGADIKNLAAASPREKVT